MADDRHIRVFHRPDDAAGHCIPFLAHRVVDGGDDPVQHCQHVVGEIHGAVGADVHFGTAEDGHIVAVLQPLKRLNLADQAFRRQAVGHAQPLGVVGDGHIFVAHCGHGGDHCLQGKLAVAPVAVHMQVAAQVGFRYQVGQAAAAGGLQLVGAPPEFGGDPGQAEAGVEGFLVGEMLGHAGFNYGNAVLVERQALPVGVVPQPDVVLLAAGEVLEHCAHPVGLAEAQVNLDAGRYYHRGFGVALRQSFADGGQGGQGRPGFGGIVGDGDEVNVADSFLPPAQGTGRRQADQAGAGGKELLHYGGAGGVGNAQGRAVGTHPPGADMLEDAGGGFCPHAGQPGKAAINSGGFQIGYRCDAQFRDGGLDGFRPHPRNFQQLQRAGRDFLRQTVVGGNAPGGDIFLHLVADGLAHAGYFAQVGAVGGRGGQRPAQLVNGAGGPLVGADFEHRIALDFQHRRHSGEQADEFVVGDGRLRLGLDWHWGSRSHSGLTIPPGSNGGQGTELPPVGVSLPGGRGAQPSLLNYAP